MFNPYLPPALDCSTANTSVNGGRSHAAPLFIVWGGYFGTCVAGTIFGLIGGPVGMMVGAILAASFGLVPFILLSFLTCVRVSRLFLIAAAAVCRSLTGASSFLALTGGRVALIVTAPIALGFLGGLLGGLCSAGTRRDRFSSKTSRTKTNLSNAELLRDALVRTNRPDRAE